MSKPTAQSPPPPDLLERKRALDSSRSILVQAPAGSGKTDLLTRRFLRLLSEVDEPGQVVAITFTNAAAAEMRNRVLDELGKTEPGTLAASILSRPQSNGWRLLDLPGQLRICTIDSFCRELALQQPLLSGFGGSLEIAEQPDELYRRAARETLKKIDETGSALGEAIETLLLWRDNGWQEMEELLVEMLKSRDRWMHGFLLERKPDWEALRERLERPFAKAVRAALTEVSELLDQAPEAREEALELARFACEQSGGVFHQELAELADFPAAPFADIEEARQTHMNLAGLLLTGDDCFRRQVDKRLGFPADRKREKARMVDLIAALASIPKLEGALAAVRNLPPARYSEEDWQIVRSCFVLLRHAAGELKIAFAEAGRVDYIEVAQIAQRVLRGEDGLPTDAALAVADGIRHLLVDEFQDTSRRQHQLLSSLIAAWPEREGRSCFVVGDPMQSIYSFREADAELFPRVKALGLEVVQDEPLRFDFVPLTANFRTSPQLVDRLNRVFEKIFATDDGSGVNFSSAVAVRGEKASADTPFALHMNFGPQTRGGKSAEAAEEEEAARKEQIGEIVALICGQMNHIKQARAGGERYRIAVLGRARSHLAPIAAALREAGIPFRAVELEKLAERPEVLDALTLTRALFNPQDRVSWLGVLRAPWCGLSLEDLHTIAGCDELDSHPRPIPEVLAERLALLSEQGRVAAERVLGALAEARGGRAARPMESLGRWLEEVWLLMGGAACVDATARVNLDLLWSCLDRLAGEEDLLGSGLDVALDKLTALPDPEASSEYGVQLMTIHKSKGLEFEVVIVPELQAASGRGSRKMLAWLERGLEQPEGSGEITEFLIAPFQRKGYERGSAKAWVDRVYHERESQEMRRILYVAATRARAEVHFFARPTCRRDADGSLSLAEPVNSLLATAWPGVVEEVRARFEEWKAGAGEGLVEGEGLAIAAAGESNLLVMARPVRPTLMRRLAADFRPAPAKSAGLESTGFSTVSQGKLYSRHEGGLLSRALGTAVHTLLEELARLRVKMDWESTRLALAGFEPRICGQIRGVGVDLRVAARIAAEALRLSLDASHDPIGSWILSPHSGAASEAAWVGVLGGGVRSVRVDRVFKAGSTPGDEGEDCWWIIDYKTAHVDKAEAVFELRALFAQQVEAYGEILRELHIGESCAIRAGLYYPRMLTLDWWEI